MPADPLILCLTGWAGSGKDAAAALLVEEMGFKRFAFADAVKEICAHKYDIPLRRFDAGKDSPLERHVPAWPHAHTPRDILIAHAAAARAKDDAIFARHVAHSIQHSGTDRVVISDWRFPIELAHLRTAFSAARILTARITRPTVAQRENSTEHELDGVATDLMIVNDGCISDLRDTLRSQLRPHLHTGYTIGSLTHDGS